MEFLNIFINPILKLLSVMNGIAHTQRVYPASWEIRIHKPDCLLEAEPWMADQEVNFPPVTYWERAVHVNGNCNGVPVHGNGYSELTGYVGNLPMP